MKTKRYPLGDMSDIDQPLYEQQPTETSVAFAAFKAYLEMGDQRSLEAVAQKVSKSQQLLKRWSTRWCWVNRVKARARFEQREADAAVRRAAEDKAKVWVAREASVREQEWDASEQILAKIGQMLKLPVITQKKTTEEEKDDDGRVVKIVNTTIIEPAKFDFGTAMRGLELVSKLKRLATGMETDKVMVDNPALVAAAGARVVLYLPDNKRRAAPATSAKPVAPAAKAPRRSPPRGKHAP